LIRTHDLGKTFAAAGKKGVQNVAVEALNLDIPQGEVFGLLGPNGAGKTTTVRMLCALVAPTSGEAWVAGCQVGREDAAVRSRVGILTETPGLYAKLDATANLAFFAHLYGVADVDGQVQKYLRMLGLWERRGEMVGSFSKGMRQKLAIARALLHEPPVLFLDEPTSGLDPEAARVVRDFVQELRGQGRTIFICTHNLDEADRLCDRIGVIKGRLLRVDTPERLRTSLYGTGVRVRLREVAPAYLDAVRELSFVQDVRQADGALTIQMPDPEIHNPALVRALVTAGADVQFVERVEHSLESVYFDVLAQTQEEAAP